MSPLPPLPNAPRRPVIFCILDGVGWGRRDETDAVFMADTPVLDRLIATAPNCLLKAHGVAVGLPSDADMGNSEVGHNAFGAGRVIQQGASLVDDAIASGRLFEGTVWKEVVKRQTVHFLGLVSDGNVHAHVKHLYALIEAADAAGVQRIRIHVLTDGRDVSERSALTWVKPLEEHLARFKNARIASGGGRMTITMDRYEADWAMVKRGWDTHVHGVGRQFGSASEAIETFYAEDPKVNDQWLPPFVIHGERGEGIVAPVGHIGDGDAVVLFNFRGDRAIEISRAFSEEDFQPFDRGVVPKDLYFAGMMQYDGDRKIPRNYLVDPPVIAETVPQYLALAGLTSYVISETQKYGHVTYFFNGNRSGHVDDLLEVYEEIPSDNVPFQAAPEMKAEPIVRHVVERLGEFDHYRLNIANGDMVGHSGSFPATVTAMETVDRCVGLLEEAARKAGAILIVTADHGNADEMVEIDKKGKVITENGVPKLKTSHTLNPVPFILVDPTGAWELSPPENPGIASIGATLLLLHGLVPPAGYLPGLVRLRA